MQTLPKDISFKVLNELDDKDLLNFCLSNRENKELCDNETFWMNRTYNKYRDYVEFKSPARKWKNYYLSLVYYLNLQFPSYKGFIGYMFEKASENNDKDIVNLARALATKSMRKEAERKMY